MSVSSAEQQVSSKARKSSPLLAVAEQKRSGQSDNASANRNFVLLEHRVDELNQQLHDLQSQKDWQDEINQALHGRLSAIADVVPAGVVVLDAYGKIIECNTLAEELLGLPLQGRLWREISQQCFKRRLDDGHEISTTSGKRLSVSTRSLGDQQLGDHQQGQIILLSDHTETRRLQALVSHQQRLSALGQMVSALAHQIRTPLSAALLYASHLCDQPLTEQQRHKFSEKLRSRLQHMERQVQDMLLFVKGELPLNDTISRQQLVTELNEALEVPIAEAQAQLTIKINGPSFSLRCNRDALINAVLNLVNNALQAYEEVNTDKNNKRILINLNCQQNQLNLQVRDFGPGIQAEILQRLNQPFVTTKAQGTGLGLAVVRAVAQAHQGHFQIHPSECGVSARLTLPIQSVDSSN